MNSSVSEFVKNYPAIPRKRYVKEKLFHHILNELCAQRCENQKTTEASTEYSDKFSSKDVQNDNERQKIPNYNFKLYGENSYAISFWNTAIGGNGRGHFKIYRPLTKLNGECFDEQWR